MILHGIYDNGKIIITDKKIPKGKTKVAIYLGRKGKIPAKIDFTELPACGMWRDRKEIEDSAAYVSKLRKKISGRYSK